MLRSVIRYCLFFLFTLSAFNALAQSGVVKGFVYDRASGEPVIFSIVHLEGTTYGVMTDVNGYFSLTQVKPGDYTLVATQVGYDTVSTPITVGVDAVLQKKLYLRQIGRQIQEVKVRGTRTNRRTQISAGSTTITPAEIKLLPSAGGESDVTQFLQVVPGVTFTGDQGGQLYIRGGAPSQTGILLDGTTIYNPFHTIGLYSIFETDAIRNVEVQSAGFSAQYGNRTSAILDIRTKDGNRNRLAGKASISPVMARIMLEGPIIKPKNDDQGGMTFLLAAKHSYLNQTSKSLYSGLGGGFKYGLPYAFTDVYGKVTLSGSNGSKLNLFAFGDDDRAQFLDVTNGQTTADFRWKSFGGGTNFVVSPSGTSSLISGRFSYSKYNIDYDEAANRSRTSGIDNFEANIEFTNYLPGYSQLRYGVEASGFHTTLNYVNEFGSTTDLDRRNTLAALYVLFRKNFSEKFIMEPSIRGQYYATLNKFSPEPRLGLKYLITPNVRLKAAGGLYSQNIISTKSDRDIVNFFTGFLLSPDKKVNDVNGNPIEYNLLKAWHALGGIEVDIADVEFNLEPWYKKFTQNIELNRFKQFSSDPDFVGEVGDAYGIDLSAKYAVDRLYLWGAVSYQKITRTTRNTITNTVQTYPPPFDRRINANFLGAYRFGKTKDLEVSLRYNVGSPFPFTQTQGFYEDVNLVSSGVGGNYLQQNGQLGLLYADQINGGRLSWFHRVDVSAKKRFQLTKNANLETTFAITNVANRDNIFYVNRVSNTRVYQLPIFPSLNVTLNF